MTCEWPVIQERMDHDEHKQRQAEQLVAVPLKSAAYSLIEVHSDLCCWTCRFISKVVRLDAATNNT